MKKAKILIFVIISSFSTNIYCENSTEEPILTTEATQNQILIEEAGTSKSISWQPYATLYSGSQAFYSPPNYGKQILKPVQTYIPPEIEAIDSMVFSQKFSGFSNNEPPPYEVYKDLEEQDHLYSSVDRNKFSSLPPYFYSTPTSLHVEYEPIQLPSDMKSSAYGSLLAGAHDDIPTYIEPVLKPSLEGPHEENDLKNPIGDIYNLYVYNDMSSTESPEQPDKNNQNKRPVNYSKNSNKFNHEVGTSPLKPVFGPPFKKFNRFRSKPFKRRRKRPFPRSKFRRRRKQRFRKYRPRPLRRPFPPLRGPPKKHQDLKAELEDESYSMMDNVGPLAALATLIPVGLILSTITPTFFGKRKRRSTAMGDDWNPTLNIIDKYDLKQLDDMVCLQRVFCEVMVQEHAKANAAIRLITYLLARMKNDKKERLGLQAVTTSIHQKDCSAFKCTKIIKGKSNFKPHLNSLS